MKHIIIRSNMYDKIESDLRIDLYFRQKDATREKDIGGLGWNVLFPERIITNERDIDWCRYNRIIYPPGDAWMWNLAWKI
eukprot:UN29940